MTELIRWIDDTIQSEIVATDIGLQRALAIAGGKDGMYTYVGETESRSIVSKDGSARVCGIWTTPSESRAQR